MMLNQDSENEIERMAKVLCACKFDTCKDCMRQSSTTAYRCEFLEQAKILVNAGIGDKKQAVKEFKDIVTQIIADAFIAHHGKLIIINEIGDKLNERFNALYGGK